MRLESCLGGNDDRQRIRRGHTATHQTKKGSVKKIILRKETWRFLQCIGAEEMKDYKQPMFQGKGKVKDSKGRGLLPVLQQILESRDTLHLSIKGIFH